LIIIPLKRKKNKHEACKNNLLGNTHVTRN